MLAHSCGVVVSTLTRLASWETQVRILSGVNFSVATIGEPDEEHPQRNTKHNRYNRIKNIMRTLNMKHYFCIREASEAGS